MRGVFLFLKKHVPLIVAAFAAVIFFFKRGRSAGTLANVLDGMKKDHDDETKRIEDAQKLELQQLNDNKVQFDVDVAKADAKYDAAKIVIDGLRTDAQGREAAKNVDDLAADVAKSMGFEVKK